MDTIIEAPPDEGVQDLNLVTTSEWSGENSQEVVNNNSTYLYIAVEYVKNEYKVEPAASLPQQQDPTFDFQQHVSPLDPNMSSVARYSPVYNEPASAEYNPIVIHQLVQHNTNGDLNLTPNSALETMPVLCQNDIREVVENHLLQMVAPEDSSDPNSNQELQLIPENEQEVELLITDQATGISYSVRSQELLIERCLEDEQLLNSLTPDPLMDGDLLTLDENTLKTELTDDIMNSEVVTTTVGAEVVNNYISNLTVGDLSAVVGNDSDQFKMETRRNRNNDVEFEDQLLARVYSIIDKPVPSRARATLPESYLIINKIDEGIGIFAKKTIPKRTQFGPLAGVLVGLEEIGETASRGLQFLVENENGGVNFLDVSDENTSNWMSFVRPADNYEEQNLVISQEGNDIYFTTTKNIVPKQELKIGYSSTYATRHKLSWFQPKEDKSWVCFECTASFATSEELQKHLNVHDDDRDENTKPRKKFLKNIKRKLEKPKGNIDSLKCNDCDELFLQPGKVALRQHLIEKHSLNRFSSLDDYFSSVTNYSCGNCDAVFNSEALLKIHGYLHNSDTSDEQTNHICPACQRKFPTQRQLVGHISTHVVFKVPHVETFKCPVCHKIFALRERLRRHMLVHGSDDSKPLQCKTCNKRFLNNSALAGHLKTHFVGKKVFECPICKESFDHVLKLKLHVPKHCENNVYACPHCSKIFKKYSIIRKHIRAFHCDQKHACPHCAKMFPTVDKLKMHMLRHSDHREFLCADCGKQFKRKDKLKEHCKRMHSEERENNVPRPQKSNQTSSPPSRKLSPKTEPTDFHRFIYKCHTCLVGFKRRGMLVNHLANRHPDISPDSVPELNLPILQTTRDYYCQHCDKVYKSSSKRKAHILKNHPGAALPMSNRKQGSYAPDGSGLPNPTFSQTVGSITTRPQSCKWCHKQYASKAKLLQHQRKKHSEELAEQTVPEGLGKLTDHDQNEPRPIEEVNIEEEDSPQDDFKEYKVTEADILNSALEDFPERDGAEQYCHLVAIASNDNFTQNTELNTPNSHLYRLLTTTSSGMVPPR